LKERFAEVTYKADRDIFYLAMQIRIENNGKAIIAAMEAFE
jgi:hypothetical protein